MSNEIDGITVPLILYPDNSMLNRIESLGIYYKL